MTARASAACGAMAALALAMTAALPAVAEAEAGEPNPPAWPGGVAVFGPEDDAGAIADAVNTAFALNGGQDPPNHGQFSPRRFAFLFKPGTYEVDVPVGFYTQVLGLGDSPNEVAFVGARGVYSEEGAYAYTTGALDTFWRGAENFAHRAPWSRPEGSGMLWAVSQAAPLRRIHVTGDLMLYEEQPPQTAAGYASGGYASGLDVSGTVAAGSQQQFFVRNSRIGGWTGGGMNIVLGGVEGAPPSHCGNAGGTPITAVDTLPLTSEKPFIVANGDGKTFSLVVPPVLVDSSGPDSAAAAADTSARLLRASARIDFADVYVAQPSDGAERINAKLRSGRHVVLSPGIYELDAPLELVHDDQVLLGIGLATLVAANATSAVCVGNVDGARVAGVLVQAGPPTPDGRVSDTLIEWGDGSHAGDARRPGFAHDVFVRVGGPDGGPSAPVGAGTMLRIGSGNVVGDNLWLWRADHIAAETTSLHNPCDHGLDVRGHNVTMYGLAVEHTLDELVQWSGEGGRTYFYQSEFPYGVNQTAWPADRASYRVDGSVKEHDAVGVGAYSFFRDHDVTVDNAFAGPGTFIGAFSVYLSGHGGIAHVLNGMGDGVFEGGGRIAYLC